MPRPPAQVAPYVNALGPELAVTVLLHYGGAELRVRMKPNPNAGYVDLIGVDASRALAREAESGWMPRRVPLVNAWLAAMLHWQGYSTIEIARKLRVSDVTVRGYLNKRKG
jgi:hypothetical protein